MALSNATIWEVRTAGSDTNGGGFVATGTDYSQQDSKNTVGSNISTTDAVANGTTTITSATAAFTSAITGNVIYLNGAWYQATYVSATSITVDRTVTTATGLTLNIGGALATPRQALTNAIAHNTIYVKSGTYTITTAIVITLTNVSSTYTPLVIAGYGSTRDDGGTRPLITCATNSINLFELNSASNIRFRHMSFSHTASTRGNGFHAKATASTTGLNLVDCVLDGFAYGIYGDFNVDWQFTMLIVESTEIKNCTTAGIKNSGVSTILNCFIHDNSGHGINFISASPSLGFYTVIGTILYNNTGAGITGNQTGGCGVSVLGCSIISNTGDGIACSATGSQPNNLIVQNTILVSNGGYGINCAGGQTIGLNRNNAFYNNTSGARNSVPVGLNEVTLTGTPFTNPAGGDFTLNGTSGAGAACKAAGYQWGA